MAEIDVTQVRIRLHVSQDKKLLAFASVTLNGEFIVHDVKVLDSREGLYVAMPAKKGKDSVFRDVAHPLTVELRQKIEDAVLDAYESELKTVEANGAS